MGNNGNKQKKKFLYVLLVVFLVIVLIGLGCVLFIFVNNWKAQNDYNNIKSSVEATNAQSQTSDTYDKTTGDADLAENPIDFDSLADINDEIYAWITIPNTNVDYPVLQSKTNDLFYIDHDVNKNYLFAGSIYSELSNLRNFSDRDTVLYGHNMLDGSMFADLHKFEDEDFFNENRYIYVYQKNRKLTYEIVSAYNYDSRHIMNSFNFADDNVFEEYINDVMNPHSSVHNVNSDVELNLDSKLLTLSTCLNGNNDGRFLVQGVLIKDEQTY